MFHHRCRHDRFRRVLLLVENLKIIRREAEISDGNSKVKTISLSPPHSFVAELRLS